MEVDCLWPWCLPRVLNGHDAGLEGIQFSQFKWMVPGPTCVPQMPSIGDYRSVSRRRDFKYRLANYFSQLMTIPMDTLASISSMQQLMCAHCVLVYWVCRWWAFEHKGMNWAAYFEHVCYAHPWLCLFVLNNNILWIHIACFGAPFIFHR